MERRSSDWRGGWAGGQYIREEWVAREIKSGNPVILTFQILHQRTSVLYRRRKAGTQAGTQGLRHVEV